MFAEIAASKCGQSRASAHWKLDAERRRTPGAWSRERHGEFGAAFRAIVRTLLTLQLRDPATHKPRFPRARFGELHPDLLDQIIGFL